MTRAEELDLRERQLRAREGMTGFNANTEELKRRIAELKAGA